MASVPKSFSARRPAREPKPEKPRAWNSTLAPGKGLSPVGKNEARRDEVDGPQAEACRIIGVCCACGTATGCDPHHEPPVSLGGLDKDTVPLCRTCHDRRHATTARSFWRSVGLAAETVKEAVRDWMAAGYPQGSRPFGGAR